MMAFMEGQTHTGLSKGLRAPALLSSWPIRAGSMWVDGDDGRVEAHGPFQRLVCFCYYIIATNPRWVDVG